MNLVKERNVTYRLEGWTKILYRLTRPKFLSLERLQFLDQDVL